MIIPIKPYLNFQDKYSTEVSISPHGECNLRCTFCFDRARYNEFASYDACMKTADRVCKLISSIQTPYIVFRFYGGEVFQDKFGDDVYQGYYDMLDNIFEYSKILNKKSEFIIVTNLMHHDHGRPTELIKRYNAKLNPSVDFKGRFTKQSQWDLFYENLKFYDTLGVVNDLGYITTPDNIKAIHDNDESQKRFDYLYKNYKLTCGFAAENGSGCQATSDDVFEHMKFLYNHYPNVAPINAFIDALNKETPKRNLQSCPGFFVTHNSTAYTCCNCTTNKTRDPSKFDYYKLVKKQYSIKHCHVCKYFDICPNLCVNIWHSDNNCFQYRMFEYIQSKS